MEKTEKQQLQSITTFKAPMDLMWKCWTLPEYITNWWGPDGFSSTIHAMDVRENGEWKLTLHGPDGTNYPNKSVFKEIIPHKKIVFEHFYPHFMTTVLFESQGETTRVDWTMAFATPDMYETVVKAHKADEGQKQNIKRLENYLAILQRGSV